MVLAFALFYSVIFHLEVLQGKKAALEPAVT
mgnify:CR=1 FL=1